MPPVVVAVAVGTAAYAAGVTLVTAITIAAAAAALYMVATMDIPKMPGTDPANAKQTIRTPNQPCRRIFGTAMVGGVLSFAEEYLHESGYEEEYESCTRIGGGGRHDEDTYVCTTRKRWVDTSKKWLHLIVVLAAHECEDITEVYFGDELKTELSHEYWQVNFMKGDQTKIEDLPQALRDVPSWTDKMIGKGITYVHVMLRHSTKHFPNGIPSIKCLVKGTKLKTPFFNGFGNNAAACIYHYLRYQFGATEKMINTASFTNEFGICNESMPNEAPVADPSDVGKGSFPIRYATDGAFDYDESHENVLKKLLTACGGSLIFTNGQYYLQVAAYRGPLSDKQIITLDNLNGPLSISPDTALGDRINTVKGQYLEPEGNYLQTDFKPVTNQAYIDEDGGEERVFDADFEFVLNKHQAHRLANIILKDNRYGLTVNVPMNLSGFKFNAGLLVGLDEKTLGYDKLEFRVTNWKLDPKGGVQLTLKQTAADIYDDSLAPVQPKPTETGLPDSSFCYPVQRLTFEALEDDGVYDGFLWWSHPDLSNVREFEIVATSTGGEIFRFNTGKDTEFRLQNMRGVTYNITVTAFNLYGAPSAPVTITTKVGDPKPITGIRFEPENFEIVLTPLVSGALPQNSRFSYFRANTTVPDKDNVTYIGEGVTFTDVGLIPNTAYHYYVRPINGSAMGDLAGPYATKTTDDPDDIYDLIKDEIPGQFTWVVYATDAFGAGISKTYNPAIHKYEGRAYNKSVEEPSLNPLDYTFFRIDEFISDADQAILDNLAKGKLPDGSANLVKPSDVLYKPGDAAEGIINNLAQGKLPDGSGDLISADDVLYKPGDAAEGIINNLAQGKLPDGSANLVKPSDVLYKPGDAAEGIINNLAQGKLPDGSGDLISADDVLYKPGDAAEGIINNLAQGKLPDGSANLVKPSDVLYKPGDPAEAVISNLEQGKLPDGSANLVKPSDVLFGPGDKVQGTNIADGAISTPKLTANAVTADKISANAVTAAKIAAGAITAAKIAANTITSANIKAGAITSDEIASNSVSADKMVANTITAAQIAAGAITASELAANTITAAQIATGAITADELAADSVSSDKIIANAITTSKINAGAITASKIAANTITAAHIKAGTITAQELSANSVSSDKIVANAITTAKINAGAVTATEIAAQAITADKIKAGAVTATKLAANSVESDKIVANAITTAKIKAGAVTATEIASNTITAAQIAAGAVTASELAANSVSSDKIVANAITAAKISAGAVTATQLAANSVTADKIVANSISANKIQAGAITADKIAVTVVSPVNNYSEFGNLRGWTVPAGTNLVEEISLGSEKAQTLKVVSSSATKAINAEPFSIDHNSIYEVKFSIYCASTTNTPTESFGLYATDSGGTRLNAKLYHPVTLAEVSSSLTPNFWQGQVSGGWRNMVAYIVGANADVNAAPKSHNVSYIIKLDGGTRKVQLSTQVLGGGNIRDIHFYSPSVTKIGSGLLVANEIRAGSRISAPVIDGGTINGGVINGATGNFEGEIRAAKMIGLPSSMAADAYISSNRFRSVSFQARKGSEIFSTPADGDDRARKYGAVNLGTIKIPPEQFERKLIITFNTPEIHIPLSAFTTNLDESVISGSTVPVQNITFFRVVKKSGNPSNPDTNKYPYDRVGNDSTLSYRYTKDNNRIYEATREHITSLTIPAVTDDKTAPDIEYQVQFAILPRYNQTLPAFTAKLYFQKLEAVLVKSEGYDFDVNIYGTL